MKFVLISQKISLDKHKQLNFSLETNWVNFLKKRNVIAVPIISEDKDIDNYFKKYKPSHLIISGGNDVFHNSKADKLRRRLDKKLIKISFKRKIPILAVCYGFQFVAKLFGGEVVKFKNESKKYHNIFFEKKKISVNSFHNYSIKRIPKEFKILAKHQNNTIEVVFSKKYKILCTMFHPERKNKSQSYVDNLLFSYLKI